MILVEYQALTRAPREILRRLYSLLNEPHFEHDFENVEYQADDFDVALGARGLHTVRRRVEWVERQCVLPPALFERFAGDMFWRFPEANIRGVPIIQFTG
jgi:sulfotransferase